MEIIIAEHFGMCFGVRDALAEAERLAAEGPLTILGELVHNPIVRERLQERGVGEGVISNLASARSRRVMITAHGASDSARAAWKAAGYAVADGTCPLVRRAHAQLRALVQAGYFPVVIGQRGHVEVQGLIGDFPKAVVLESSAEIAELPPNEERFGIISQTTQPIGRVRELVAQIQAERPAAEVRFCDTVCQPTKNRQRALHKLIAECDTIVAVGGRGSNNTRQLVETAQRERRRVFHIERPEDLQRGWFTLSVTVGLTAGTSTLPETVSAVHARLLQIAGTL